MRTRAAIILILGVAAAVAGYCAVYFCSTSQHRALLDSPAPELAWLKREFRLSDAEFQRITKLHRGYLPRCGEMCARIADKNDEIRQLIGSTNADVRQIEQKLAEAGQLRLQCQSNMLHHFIAVSQAMPPEQGRRYLAWMEERTLIDTGGMMAHHQPAVEQTTAPEPAMPEHHH